MDFDALWQSYQGERQRAVAALDYLQQQGWIELESKQMTEVYRITRQGWDNEQEAKALHALFLQKEQSELARLQAMLDFFTSSECLSHRLARYFADEVAPVHCGHCSVCRGEVAHLPPLPQLAMPNAAGDPRLVRSADCQNRFGGCACSDPFPVRYHHTADQPDQSQIAGGRRPVGRAPVCPRPGGSATSLPLLDECWRRQ